MPAISVAIACANAADTLAAACASVPWADEIVIVDSGSADATAAIAQQYATRYVVEPWRGYVGQKQLACSLCRNDWVIVLDGDEEISPGLAREIQTLSDADLAKLDVLYMRRRNWMMGRVVRSWLPDWQSRLIHRQRVTWTQAVLHDNRLPADPARVRRLRGFMEHRRTARRGFLEYFDGRLADSRLVLVASDLHRRGRRCHWYDLAFRPWGAFVKHYLLKRGVFEGTFGLLIAQKAALAVQLKYAALWAAQEGYLELSAPPAAREPAPAATEESPDATDR